jgi:outer membrane lipoprotein carrier protein
MGGMRTFIFLIGSLLAATSAEAGGLDQLKSFLGATKSLRGSFTQTVVGKSGRKPQQSAGAFAISRPGKFRWTYEKPYQQLLVSDGDRLWTYDPDLRQATVRRLGQALGSSPAALLAGDALDNNFALTEAGSRDGFEFVEAVPKATDASFERLRIGLKDNLPRIMEVQDNFGQTTTLYLNQLEPQASLSAELFRFTPPKGADVVGE